MYQRTDFFPSVDEWMYAWFTCYFHIVCLFSVLWEPFQLLCFLSGLWLWPVSWWKKNLKNEIQQLVTWEAWYKMQASLPFPFLFSPACWLKCHRGWECWFHSLDFPIRECHPSVLETLLDSNNSFPFLKVGGGSDLSQVDSVKGNPALGCVLLLEKESLSLSDSWLWALGWYMLFPSSPWCGGHEWRNFVLGDGK